jgi:Arc/MetJ-type ribon-helix-helix transcriptional regulator
MTYQFPADVERLIREHMATGIYRSEDDVLRDALKTLGEFFHSEADVAEEYRQTAEAVREGIADVNAGRLRPIRGILNDGGRVRSDESK